MILNLDILTGMAMESYFNFNLSDGKQGHISIHMLLCHVCVFFGQESVQFLAIFIWIIFFLTVEFQVYFI
jgi:hypothetical protein